MRGPSTKWPNGTLLALLTASSLGCAPSARPVTAEHSSPSRPETGAVAVNDVEPPPIAWERPAKSGGGRSRSDASREGASEAAGPSRPSQPADRVEDEAALRRAFEHARPVATLRGRATYYSDALAGRLTASGEPYRPTGFTAAHRTLPFGTVLRVRRVDGEAEVYVRVTDRGPFGRHRRIIDLSRAAALRIGLIRPGVADVVVEVLALGRSGGPRPGR